MTLPRSIYLLIDGGKLPAPGCIVQELSEVKPIVVRRVALGMIGGRQCRHLVPIDGIAAEEVFNLLCCLQW